MTNEDMTWLREEYYHTRCPYKELYEIFLARPLDDSGTVGMREVAFDMHGGGPSWRYLYFRSAAEFRSTVIKNLPRAIHLGAITEQAVSAATSSYLGHDLSPITDPNLYGREIIFDVDIEAWDTRYGTTLVGDLRDCPCKGISRMICRDCWRFAKGSMRVLHYVMTTIFSLKKLLFVFSGNRGYHLWVMDREALIEYPRQKCEDIVRFFNNALTATNSPILQRLHRKVMQPFVKQHFAENPRYLELEQKKGPVAAAMAYLWPRLDQKVTLDRHHLAKMPFSLHPRTGKVCLVIDPFTDDSDRVLECNADENDIHKSVRYMYSVINSK